MFMMTVAASLCSVVLISGLLKLACRHRDDLWITSDDAILCFVAPVVILLLTVGGVSLGYRLGHGGLAAVSIEGWIGGAVIIAISAGLWLVLARWVRESGRKAPASTIR